MSEFQFVPGASTSVGRQSKGTHVVLGAEGGESKWRQLDAKVVMESEKLLVESSSSSETPLMVKSDTT